MDEELLPRDLEALKRFAVLMDEAVAIPGTRRRVGLDAALGLIPGVGSAVGGVLSAWIVIGALRHRVRALTIGRMLFNIVLDVTIGAIPFLGDVFDWLWEENVMNLQLLLKHRDRSRPPRSTGQIIGGATLILAIILLFAIGAAAGVLVLVIWLIRNR
ncbi:MAG TPA: DUF4112 domain-containing protein [Thermoanaerobaculia bacterium]